MHLFFPRTSFLLCFTIMIFSANTYCDIPETPKTLDRWVDPVIMDGGLATEMIGKPNDNLRLYACKNKKFEPIRFQIDEMTSQDGDWIFPEGPLPNGELSNSTFDTWDKLIFMADDTGDKAPESEWTQGYTTGTEIEITDPLTGEKGWCYLLYFDANPPPRSSLPDYAVFDYENNTETSDYRRIKDIITEDGMRTTYYEWFSIPKEAGGNDESFVDRLKIRITAKMFFNTVTLRFTEEKIKSSVIAYKRGPIRTNKRVEQYMLLPGNIKAVRAVTDIIQYRATATCPVIFQVPFKLNRLVSSLTMRFGTDYNRNAVGARVINSSNPKGFIVDGKMDADELNNFNSEFDQWRLITGECGTFMTRTLIPSKKAFKHIKITMGIIDDTNQEFPPESEEGSIGYLYQDWDIGGLPKGTYYAFLEFYWVPNYKQGDESKYTNYMDNPLMVQVGEKEDKSQVLLFTTNLCKRYK